MNELMNSFYRLLEAPEYSALLALVFVTVSMMIMSIYIIISRKSYFKDRLERFMPGEKDKQSSRNSSLVQQPDNGVVRKVTEPIFKAVLPEQEKKRKSGQLKLIRAGLNGKNAYRNYLLVRLFCTIFFPLAFLIYSSFYKLTPEMIALAAAMALVGFFLPAIALQLMILQRQQEIMRALPDALDLMVVCTEAGLGLDMTFKRVGEEIRPLSKALSDEYRMTIMEIRAGRSRSESFRYMANRTGVREVGNLMTILVQASRFGTSMAKALRVHSESMRVKRRQIAEEKAAKVAVKLIFPLILFIFPALMIVIGGPAFISIYRVLFPALAAAGG